MAVGFRAAGAWENGATGLTADEVLAVPAAQLTGDLVLVLGAWKDFSITAQVAGYTEITQFTDGSTGTGNGTGSMKVGAWYKVATSDTEADPTLDFSTTTNLLGEGTILVFSKGAGETWLTPTFVTAAWPNGGSSPQTVNADSTISVPSGGAVVGLIGIRDDSATFTRGNTALDDSTGAITWNGNYAEQPATHASTTTGNDMSCDAGYRLVTTGATATLRQTATLSANETGAMLWVVLGVFTPDPKTAEPTALALTWTGATPTVIASDNKTAEPTVLALTWTGATPTVAVTANVLTQPSALELTWTGATPAVVTPVATQPTSLGLTLTLDTPAVAIPVTSQPTALAFSLSLATPAVSTPVASQPTALEMAWTGATPAVVAPVAIQPDALALALTFATPAIGAGENQEALPDALALGLTFATPAVATPTVSAPTSLALDLEFATPTVAAPRRSQPSAFSLAWTGATPDVQVSLPGTYQPSALALHLAFATPIITVGGGGLPVVHHRVYRAPFRPLRHHRVLPPPMKLGLNFSVPIIEVTNINEAFELMALAFI